MGGPRCAHAPPSRLSPSNGGRLLGASSFARLLFLPTCQDLAKSRSGRCKAARPSFSGWRALHALAPWDGSGVRLEQHSSELKMSVTRNVPLIPSLLKQKII